jgi:hypothetical protein
MVRAEISDVRVRLNDVSGDSAFRERSLPDEAHRHQCKTSMTDGRNEYKELSSFSTHQGPEAASLSTPSFCCERSRRTTGLDTITAGGGRVSKALV